MRYLNTKFTRTPALIGSSMGIAEVFRQVGLSYLITDFTSTEDVSEKVKEVVKLGINDKVRKKLKKALSPDKVYSQLVTIVKTGRYKIVYIGFDFPFRLNKNDVIFHKIKAVDHALFVSPLREVAADFSLSSLFFISINKSFNI